MLNYNECKYLLLRAVSRESLCISIKMCSLKKERWGLFLQYFPSPLRTAQVSCSSGGWPCLDLQTPTHAREILLQQILLPGIPQDMVGRENDEQDCSDPSQKFRPSGRGVRDHNRQGLCSLCSSTGINMTFTSSPSAQHQCTRV